jgi:DNA sulfur modification protein DndC
LTNSSDVVKGVKPLDVRYDEIRTVYLSDQRPWVIGYSGGKDSTTALQIVWHALTKLPTDKLSKPVYIISSDTLVETPKIVDYINSSLERMNQTAARLGLPFSAHKVKPELNNTFWVNLLGRGLPAPSTKFRWCTERMKIQPANKFILEKVAHHGEVVVVLGVRSSESATRAQVMSLHRIKDSLLSRHSTLPNAFVYTPIEDFTVDDVWTYLLQVPSPWGNNNRDLVTMYRNAQAGECPLVVDTTTPSCGNSRFGCWVCTVVERDKSMEAMLENGEDWLEPMIDFREQLASTQNPAVKLQIRELKGRNGQVRMKEDGKTIIPGPYKLDVVQKLLTRLLETQKQVRTTGPNPNEEFISFEELEQIRRLWRSEKQDWEDSVPRIYREVMGKDLPWATDEHPGFTNDDKVVLESIANQYDVPTNLVAKLIELERAHHGMSRRASIHQKLSAAFDEDWRTEEELLSKEDKSPA